MKISNAITTFALFTLTTKAASLPDADNVDHYNHVAIRALDTSFVAAPDHTLERRKGGGGRGGGSSGGRAGSGSSSAGGSSGRTSSSSSTGGATSRGSGPSRSFGGGGYYGGGAAVPYGAGKKTPKGLLAGALLLPAAALLLLPGIWLWSVYPYAFTRPYSFYNQSANINSSLPVTCLCQEFSVCSCDENDNQQYLKDLIGNGSYATLNKTLISVADYNGTAHLILNGTLPNGTTAPGGTDDAAVALGLGRHFGYWAMGLVVLYGVLL